MENEHEELIKQLRGVQRIVINRCYGGFSLSRSAKIRYLDLAGIEYEEYPQQDRHSQQLFGNRILVNGRDWSDYEVARDDPALVAVVRELGAEASGNHSKLKIVEIPPGIEWTIEEYDGNEWIAEKHRTWR